MKVGTKSVLFGAHCFLWHPLFVAIAWIKLYGWPWDPRIWIAFFVHDLGYWGKPNMDGPEGELHVEFGASVMHWLFDRTKVEKHVEYYCTRLRYEELFNEGYKPLQVVGPHIFFKRKIRSSAWRDFCLYHSRYYAKKNGVMPSRLCFADKLSICITPRWLYLPFVNATGEIKEYMKNTQKDDSSNWTPVSDQEEWFDQLQSYMRKWVEEHVDGSEDTWTDGNRNVRTERERTATSKQEIIDFLDTSIDITHNTMKFYHNSNNSGLYRRERILKSLRKIVSNTPEIQT